MKKILLILTIISVLALPFVLNAQNDQSSYSPWAIFGNLIKPKNLNWGVQINGSSIINGLMNFNVLPESSQTPTTSTQFVRKQDLDNAVANIQWRQSVIDVDLSTPPGSPATSSRYIIKATGTGDWSGHDTDIATWNGSAWTFEDPQDGWTVVETDSNKAWTYNATLASWVLFTAQTPLTASNGVKRVGDDFQADYDDSTINLDGSGKLQVKDLGIVVGKIANGAVDLLTKVTGILPRSNGGTGTSTSPTAGQLLIGKTDGSYNLDGLKAGSNVSITNGDGSITISSTGGGTSMATSTFGNTKYLPWVANGASYSTWTDFPSVIASNFLMSSTSPNGGTQYYKRYDLNNVYRFRTVRNLSVAGFAGSYMYLEYSYDKTNWYRASTDDDCTLVGTGAIACPWASLATGARTDVYLRYRGLGGNDIVDPRFYNLVTEFTTYASTENENATSTDQISFVTSPTTNQAWPNMPLAKSGTYYQGFGSVYHRTTANLYNSNKYRILATIATTTTATYNPLSTMRIDVQYSYDQTNWFNLNSGLASPGVGAGELDISQNVNQINVGSWVDIAEGGKGNVYLRFVGYGGNGVNDIYFRNLDVQIDGRLEADVTYVDNNWHISGGVLTPTTTIPVALATTSMFIGSTIGDANAYLTTNILTVPNGTYAGTRLPYLTNNAEVYVSGSPIGTFPSSVGIFDNLVIIRNLDADLSESPNLSFVDPINPLEVTISSLGYNFGTGDFYHTGATSTYSFDNKITINKDGQVALLGSQPTKYFDIGATTTNFILYNDHQDSIFETPYIKPHSSSTAYSNLGQWIGRAIFRQEEPTSRLHTGTGNMSDYMLLMIDQNENNFSGSPNNASLFNVDQFAFMIRSGVLNNYGTSTSDINIAHFFNTGNEQTNSGLNPNNVLNAGVYGGASSSSTIDKATTTNVLNFGFFSALDSGDQDIGVGTTTVENTIYNGSINSHISKVLGKNFNIWGRISGNNRRVQDEDYAFVDSTKYPWILGNDISITGSNNPTTTKLFIWDNQISSAVYENGILTRPTTTMMDFIKVATSSNDNILFLDKNGNLGLGKSPTARLDVSGMIKTDDDVYITDTTKGIVQKSPDGNCWRTTVTNAGALSTNSITCP